MLRSRSRIILKIVALCSGILIIHCPKESQKNESTRDQNLLVQLLWINFQASGSCVVAEKLESGQSLIHCINAPRTACRADALFDPFSQRFIVTEETTARYLSAINERKDEIPECETAAALAASNLITTTDEKAQEIKDRTRYFTVESCESLELSGGLNNFDYNFFRTDTEGRLLLSAYLSSQTDCSNRLGTESQRELAKEVARQNQKVFVSCIYDGLAPGIDQCGDLTDPYEVSFE